MLKSFLAFIALTFFSSTSLWAISGKEVMIRVDQNNKRMKTMKAEVLMVITNPQGKRERNFYHWKKYDQSMTKSLIKFYLPSTVKGTALLTHSKDGETKSAQWIYFPALRKTQQITGDRSNESFMGSDFSYSDVSGRQLEQDTHKLLKEDDRYYYVQSVPVDGEDSYSKINVLVDKETYVPAKAVFFDRSGKKFKTLSNRKVKKFGPMYIVTDSIMENHKSGGQTTLQVSQVKRNIPLSDNDVGIKGLRK